jgi:hypothetical protein
LQLLFGFGPTPVDTPEKFSWRFASSVRSAIAQHNGMVARNFDCAASFEVPQSGRYRLNGQAKIIRDIAASHWQIDAIIRSGSALDHLYEETDDPFFCSRGQK